MKPFLFLALAFGTTASAADKGTPVAFDSLKSVAPASWVKEKPANRFRYFQFKLPRAAGDKADASVVIFKGLGGSVKANVKRWQSTFVPPSGKSIDDISKVQEVKIGGRKAVRVDISGTFVDRPFPGSPKKTLRPDYQFVGIQLDGPDNPYHIKLTGPKKTVQKYLKGFNQWLESIK